jgi:hypothetical protein
MLIITSEVHNEGDINDYNDGYEWAKNFYVHIWSISGTMD